MAACDCGAADRGARPVSREVWPGRPFPLGPTWDGQGTNFSLFSEHAERVELCLFDDDDAEERIELTDHTAHNWHGYLPGVGPGPALRLPRPRPLRARAGPPLQPVQAADRPVREGDRGPDRLRTRRTCCPTSRRRTATTPTSRSTTRTTPPAIPKCVVVDERFDWEGDRPPQRPWSETVIYETHVKGFTKRRAGLREDLRGTYAGLASDEALGYLQGPRRHGGRAAAGPPHRRRVVPARPGADELLGLLLDRLPRAARAATPRPAATASRCASSRAWSRRCTARASR